MILAAIGLALAAAVLHGTWNVLVKVGGDPLATFRRATVAAAACATIAVVPAWFALGRPSLDPTAAGLAFLSGVFETAYLWLLSSAYRHGDLSVVYPIARGSAPLLAVVVGLVVLREQLTTLQLLGVGLLLLGILAVTISQTRGRATVPALLTGVAIAAYTSIDSVGVRLASPWLYGWLLFTLMAIELPLSVWVVSRFLPAAAPGPVSGSPRWRQAAVIGVFMWAGYFLVLWALRLAPLAVVAPVRELAIVAVALWAVWRLGERQAATLKIAGAFATLAGISLLAI